MKFKPFQIHDYAAAAMADGLVLAHDTGLGKSLAAITWPLLKCGFDVMPDDPHIKGSVLIVAPGDLHDQLRREFRKFYPGINPVSIEDQADLNRLVRRPEKRPQIPHGFYLTSYTRLAVNGVKKISAIAQLPYEAAAKVLNLKPEDLQDFYNRRGDLYKDEYVKEPFLLVLTMRAFSIRVDSLS